jgi:glutaconate CoA-transferase subunit A
MAELLTVAEGVAALIGSGDTVALEGFTHLIPVRPDARSSGRVGGS